MLRGWASGQKAKLTASPTAVTVQSEQEALAQAMAAAMHIMNDDLEGAEKGLQNGESSFHKLGRGLIAFLRAALGFEKDVMRDAQDKLSAAEAQAYKEQKSAQKEPNAFRSSIYETGTEYALTYAQCLLMGAVVAVLNESLTEALRGFYNLRKAYMTLNTIVDAEDRYLQKQPLSRPPTADFTTSAASTRPSSKVGSSTDLAAAAQHSNDLEAVSKEEPLVDEEGDAFEDAEEVKDDEPTPMEYQGKTEVHGFVKDLSHLHISSSEPNMVEKLEPAPGTSTTAAVSAVNSSTNLSAGAHIRATALGQTKAQSLSEAPEADLFKHPIDTYIHSGANLCFGMLLMMLSMIPPAFGKLLSIIGFRGDRERGLRLLWKASQFHNINGAMAGLVLLVFYNGLIGFCDILPDASRDAPDDAVENIEGYPIHRLEALLASLRKDFPQSGLWKLEEARMLAAKRRIDEAVPILSQKLDSPLKQVNALAVFERALQSMYSHRFELCSDSFIECIKLNSWSHALYFYLAGAAQVELYRIAIKEKDAEGTKKAAEKAQSYFGQVHENAGKRKFMAKQLPFEVFCMRKLDKWNARAKEWNVPMIEAIGPSPVEEMIYHWNGLKKMSPPMLQKSLESLQWNEKHDENWERQSQDDKIISSLLKAAVLRSMQNFDDARDILKTDVLCHDKAQITGGLRDDWTLPVAHYEMAVILWQSRVDIGGPGEKTNDQNRKQIKEAAEWIEKVKQWGPYAMDNRIGMRVTAAEGTLKKWSPSP